MALWTQTTEKEQFPENESPQPLRQEAPEYKDHSENKRPQKHKESLIAAGLVIEGKIDGTGHMRIAGHFTGDVHMDGDVTVEQGARIKGCIRAENVVVHGEVEGDIQATRRVELLDCGVLTGDLNASSLTVAPGSRMRGKVEFGWDKRDDKVVTIRGGQSTMSENQG